MEARVLLLLLICMLIAFYLELEWLIMGLAAVLFLGAIASIKMEKPKVVAVPKEASRDVIYPIIYEDVGESPYLFPPEQKIKVVPDYGDKVSQPWQSAAKGIGNIIKTGIGLISGPKKK